MKRLGGAAVDKAISPNGQAIGSTGTTENGQSQIVSKYTPQSSECDKPKLPYLALDKLHPRTTTCCRPWKMKGQRAKPRGMPFGGLGVFITPTRQRVLNAEEITSNDN